jgi:hypothetical protein
MQRGESLAFAKSEDDLRARLLRVLSCQKSCPD